MDHEPRVDDSPGPPAPEASSKAKPRVWPVYLTFVLSLGAVIVASAILTIVGLVVMVVVEAGLADGAPPDVSGMFGDGQAVNQLLENPWFLLSLVVASSGTFLCAAVAGGIFSRENIRDRLGLRRPVAMPVWLWLLIPLGGLAISSGFDDVMRLLSLQSASLALFEKLFSSSGGFGFAVAVLLVGGVVPVAEEVLFRGYLQTRLVQRHGPRLGVILASVMFGIMHMDLVHSSYATLIGLYLGHVALRCKSIWPAIAAHATVNAVSCIGCRVFGGMSVEPSLFYILADLVVCAIVVAVIVRLVERQRQRLPAASPPDGEGSPRGLGLS
jgi:hypothetical protein